MATWTPRSRNLATVTAAVDRGASPLRDPDRVFLMPVKKQCFSGSAIRCLTDSEDALALRMQQSLRHQLSNFASSDECWIELDHRRWPESLRGQTHSSARREAARDHERLSRAVMRCGEQFEQFERARAGGPGAGADGKPRRVRNR